MYLHEPHFGEVKVTHDLGWWLFGKPVIDFLLTLIELFRCLLRFRSYEAKYVQLGSFLRGSTLHSNFTWTVVPVKHSWRQKTRDTELPDGEDRIPLRSFV